MNSMFLVKIPERIVQALTTAALLMLPGIGSAHAGLIDSGDYVLDDTSGLLWAKHTVQLNYPLTAALAQIDALNASSSLADINGDGFLDSLAWSLSSRDNVRALYDSYSLSERNAAFGQGNRSLSYIPALRYSGSWTQLLSGWSSADLFGTGDIFIVPTGWGNQRECFFFPVPGGSCTVNRQDGFYGGYPAGTESGVWASATIRYGNDVPEPATLLLLAAGLLGVAGGRRARTTSNDCQLKDRGPDCG